MKIKSSFILNQKLLSFVILFFLCILTFINAYIGLKILNNPSPFISSHWDIRWALLFGFAFLFIGVLFIFSKHKLLFILSFIGLSLLMIIPIFTISLGKTYLVFILLILLAFGAGQAFLKLLLKNEIKDRMESLVISLLLGFGIIMILVMVQGFLNAFTPLVTWVGIGLMGLLFVVPNLKKWFLTIKEVLYNIILIWDNEIRLSSLSLFFGIFFILLIPSWLIALSPPMRYDEMTYHLTAPLLYLERGGIVIYPEGGMTVWMHYAEMLYTLAIQTAGLTLTRVFHLMFGMLSIVTTFLFGRRLANKKTGLIAALLLFSIPVVGYETATAYIDFFVTAYTTAVGFTLLLFWREQNPRWLLVAGFLGGIGLGIKLTAGPVIAVMVGIFLIITIIQRLNVKNYLWIAGMIIIILALAMPWFIRDTFWTGDPFYPYGTRFLQRFSQSTLAGEISQPINLINNPERYLTYPVDITFNSYRYYHEAPGGMASVLPLMAIPFFIFSAHIKKQEKIIALLLFGTSIISVWIMILINIALIRYALPVFPWLAVCAAMNINTVSDYFSSKQGRVEGSFLLIIGLIYVFSTRLPLIARLNDNLPQRLPVNYYLGLESKEEYLSRNLAVYDAFQFVDAQENGPHRILSIGNEFRLYTESRIDSIYDVAEANKIVSSAENYDSLAKVLTDAGYDYILVNQPDIDFLQWKYSDPYPILKNGDFLDLYAKLVFAENGVYIYKFVPSGIVLPVPKNLVINPGFEEKLSENIPAHWDIGGFVKISDEDFEGDNSLLIGAPGSGDGFGFAQQVIDVTSGENYTLGYRLRSDEPSVFLMRVHWLDEYENIISTEERWKNVYQDWEWNVLHSTAPDGAQSASVVASWGGDVSGFVDDVCFAEGQMCP